ncbi:MAG: MarR family transcriptional regulator [Erysipelotrichia bacterium]|nr:MarR family transcriptional regulator [Erysipelotrichia bacterium]
MYSEITFKMIRINQLKKWHNAVNLRKHGEMFFGQMPMLEYIDRHPGCNQKMIADRFAFTRAAISKAVTKLVNKNLVIRKTNDIDGREYQLYLTDSGRESIKMFSGCFEEVNKLSFQNFTKDELEQFDHLLTKMLQNLETDYTCGKNPEKLIKEFEKIENEEDK